MNNIDFVNHFIKHFREMKLNSEHPNEQKRFNQNLRNRKYLLIYPFVKPDEDNISLLVGFSDEAKVFKMSKEDSFKAYKHVEYNCEIVNTDKERMNFDETIVVETSTIEKLDIAEAKWTDFINAPKIEDGDFSILENDFLEFFGLDSHAHNYETGKSFNFNTFFQDKNIPKDLELRVVWKDIDSGEKYGNIITSVFWREEFIGWISTHGKWLDTHNAHTINIDKWTDFMEYLKKLSGFQPREYIKGVIVSNMDTDFVEDVTYVTGFSTIDYSDS